MMQIVYFLGIGGIGMSALARYYASIGAWVAGYDLTPSPLTAALEQEGMVVHYEDDIASIPQPIISHPNETLVIYTPAIPHDHKVWNYLKQNGYRIIKRANALGEIARSKVCLAVAGTHGKTSTTTLLAHIFTHSGVGCTAFLGGISKNYQTNLLLNQAPWMVVEADEFDRSFLQLHPHMAVVTSIDADHLDIYGDLSALIEAFSTFTTQISPNGALVLKEGIEALTTGAGRLYRYALDQKSDFYASDICIDEEGFYRFSLHLLDHVVADCRLTIPGRINIENAVAASALSFLNGITPHQIRAALATFSGVSRRFDLLINRSNCVYIDDYAHHPAEISATLMSIRKIYSGRKITAIFQPHLYTRTRDFADAFGVSLSLPDELILLPVYPAREEPIKGVNSEMLLNKVTISDKHLINKEDVIPFLSKHPVDVLVTMGAGDIDRLVPHIKTLLASRI